jgi:hypothetical protein
MDHGVLAGGIGDRVGIGADIGEDRRVGDRPGLVGGMPPMTMMPWSAACLMSALLFSIETEPRMIASGLSAIAWASAWRCHCGPRRPSA